MLGEGKWCCATHFPKPLSTLHCIYDQNLPSLFQALGQLAPSFSTRPHSSLVSHCFLIVPIDREPGKGYNLPFPIYDLTKNLIPYYFMTIMADTVVPNIIFGRLLYNYGRIDNDAKVASSRKHTQFKTRVYKKWIILKRLVASFMLKVKCSYWNDA